MKALICHSSKHQSSLAENEVAQHPQVSNQSSGSQAEQQYYTASSALPLPNWQGNWPSLNSFHTVHQIMTA